MLSSRRSNISNQTQLSDSQLSEIVGQELIRPLSSIQLICQILAQDDIDSATQKQQLQQLRDLSERTMQLVESLLLVKSDPANTQTRPTSLIEVVLAAADSLKPWLDERQRPLKVYSRPLKPLMTQRHAIEQIIKIILKLPEASNTKEPVEIRFRTAQSRQSVRIRDYNSELSQTEWDRLSTSQFASMIQPFTNEPDDSGFDLYVAGQLARRLGGELIFEPKQIGNCFELKLPALYQPQIWQASQW